VQALTVQCQGADREVRIANEEVYVPNDRRAGFPHKGAFLGEGEEVVVEAESKGRDDEVSGDAEVLEHGPYRVQRQGDLEREIPGVLPFVERAVPSVQVERAMLVHAAAREETGACDRRGLLFFFFGPGGWRVERAKAERRGICKRVMWIEDAECECRMSARRCIIRACRGREVCEIEITVMLS
jgi:hypothetical protein